MKLLKLKKVIDKMVEHFGGDADVHFWNESSKAKDWHDTELFLESISHGSVLAKVNVNLVKKLKSNEHSQGEELK